MYGWFIAAYLLGLLTGAGLIVAWAKHVDRRVR